MTIYGIKQIEKKINSQNILDFRFQQDNIDPKIENKAIFKPVETILHHGWIIYRLTLF